MFIEIRKNTVAFTLIEIMIIVAIIGLLATLSVPVFIKARKQSQGRRILNDVRQMDAAIDAWSLETGQRDGNPIVTTQAATYLKGNQWNNSDAIGNPYVLGLVGSNQLQIATATKTSLAGVGIDWGAF